MSGDSPACIAPSNPWARDADDRGRHRLTRTVRPSTLGLAGEPPLPVADTRSPRPARHPRGRRPASAAGRRPADTPRPVWYVAGDQLGRRLDLGLAVDHDVDLRERREGEQRRSGPDARPASARTRAARTTCCARRPVTGSIDPLFSPARDMRPPIPSTFLSSTSSSGCADRQRAQQRVVDQAEDRGVGADAERQRQHGDGGEAGTLQQVADREAQVAHRGLPESGT